MSPEVFHFFIFEGLSLFDLIHYFFLLCYLVVISLIFSGSYPRIVRILVLILQKLLDELVHRHSFYHPHNDQGYNNYDDVFCIPNDSFSERFPLSYLSFLLAHYLQMYLVDLSLRCLYHEITLQNQQQILSDIHPDFPPLLPLREDDGMELLLPLLYDLLFRVDLFVLKGEILPA